MDRRALLARIDEHWSRGGLAAHTPGGAHDAPTLVDLCAAHADHTTSAALLSVEDAALRAGGYHAPREPHADMVDYWRARVRDAQLQRAQLTALAAAPRQWRELLVRPPADVARDIDAERRAASAQLQDVATEYGTLLKCAAERGRDASAEIAQRAAALRARIELDAARPPGSWALVPELARAAEHGRAVADLDEPRRAGELRAHLDARLADECAPMLAVLRRGGAHSLPYTIGASVCDWKLRDVAARIGAAQRDAAHTALHDGYTQRIGALTNTEAAPLVRNMYILALEGDEDFALISNPAEVDKLVTRRVSGHALALWRLTVFALYQLPATERSSVSDATTNALRAKDPTVIDARLNQLTLTIARSALASKRALIQERLRTLMLRRVAVLYLAAYAFADHGKQIVADEFIAKLQRLGANYPSVATILSSESGAGGVASIWVNDVYVDVVQPEQITALTHRIGSPEATLSEVTTQIIKAIREIVVERVKQQQVVRDCSEEIRGVIDRLAKELPAANAADPLAAVTAQHLLFRPDPRESGLLSAALNTMFCADPAQPPLPFSLPEVVWAHRIRELEEQQDAGTFAAAGADYGPAARLELLRGRWTPALVARAAVNLAMHRVAADSPASVGALPLLLIERLIVAVIGAPDFVTWMRTYGLDPFAGVDEQQRPPFRLVTTAHRQRHTRHYLRPTEAYARALTNDLMATPGSAPIEFIRLAQTKLDVRADQAHAAWLDVVFGPAQNPYAVLELPATADEEPMDTLDLYQQMMALVQLHALLERAAKTLDKRDQEAVAALPATALLGGVLYFVLSFLDSRISRVDGDSVLMVLALHPDGHVLYDHFAADVVTHIADTVYDWPQWSGGRAPLAHRPRAVNAEWLRRAGSRVWCTDVMGLDAIDEASDYGDLWRSVTTWAIGGSATPLPARASSLPPVRTLSSRGASGTLSPLARGGSTGTVLASAPALTRHAFARLMTRAPCAPLPYKATDLRRGQTQLYLRDHMGTWTDIGPLAGIDTRRSGGDVTWRAAGAAFDIDASYSVYDWRVTQQYYLRPAAARNNALTPRDAGPLRRIGDADDLLKDLEPMRVGAVGAELLAPPFGALTFVLEWLINNPWPSVTLVGKMYRDAMSGAPTYAVVVRGQEASDAERAERDARKQRALESAKDRFSAAMRAVEGEADDALKTLNLMCDKFSDLQVVRATLEAPVDAARETVERAKRLTHDDAEQLRERLAQAERGQVAVTGYLRRIRESVAPVFEEHLATATAVLSQRLRPVK